MKNYKDEFYVRALRCWLIISRLGKSSSIQDTLDLEKCAFFDYLIANPIMLKKCLSKFDRDQKITPRPDTLYPSNIEFGDYQEKKMFTNTAFFLEKCGYINIQKIGSKFCLSSNELNISIDHEMARSWEHNISLLKPLLSKSINVLHKSILSEINNE